MSCFLRCEPPAVCFAPMHDVGVDAQTGKVIGDKKEGPYPD